MKVETGNFDIPVSVMKRRSGKYSESFHAFKNSNTPALKYTLETEKEAMGCYNSLRILVMREKCDGFRVVKRGLNVFVLRRDDRADEALRKLEV